MSLDRPRFISLEILLPNLNEKSHDQIWDEIRGLLDREGYADTILSNPEELMLVNTDCHTRPSKVDL